jgi:Ras-related protein Rab-6A
MARTIRVAFCGDASVGKTALIDRCINNTKEMKAKYPPTMGIDFTIKIVGLAYRFMFWDIAGQQNQADRRSEYLNLSRPEIIILNFDITSRQSFDNLQAWMEIIKGQDLTKEVPILLVGNKIDCNEERKVTEEEAQRFVSANNLTQYVETSARDAIGLDLLEKAIIELTQPTQEQQSARTYEATDEATGEAAELRRRKTLYSNHRRLGSGAGAAFIEFFTRRPSHGTRVLQATSLEEFDSLVKQKADMKPGFFDKRFRKKGGASVQTQKILRQEQEEQGKKQGETPIL